jgi:site-specific DNA-methyltransferase (adenine-specific)
LTCSRKIGPYDCCSVVQGDCWDLMLSIPDGVVDAIISDPPYGMSRHGRYQVGSNGDGKGRKSNRWGETVIGDDQPFDPTPLFIRFPVAVLWGFQHFPDKLSRGTLLVWLKRYDDGFGSFLSDGEAAWLNRGCGLYVMRDVSLQGESSQRLHPTQKPEAVMEWCIQKAGNPETILDPFCGSGTTLVAAKKLGRHFLGFEISPEYCEISRDRLARIEAQPNLFQAPPEQLSL